MTDRRATLILFPVLACAAWVLTGCSRDPNVRKQSYYKAAVRYFDKGKYDAAAIELRNALQVDPRYTEAHYEMAQCDLKMGLFQQAYKELNNTVELNPKHWKAQTDLGNFFLASRQPTPARQKAELVLAGDPNNGDALALLANVEESQGHQDQALADMTKSVQLAPTAPKYLNRALLEERAKQLGEAEEDYKKAIAVDPKSAAPVLALQAFYARQHRFSDAEAEAQHAIGIAPKDPQPRAALVGLYLAQNETDKAEQAAKDAKQAVKSNPQGYRILGEFYVATGQRDKAIAEYASLHKDHPKDLVVGNAYTELLISQNDLGAASKVNAQVLHESAADVEAVILKGRILTLQGHVDDAVLTLQSALKTQPDNPALHYFLGAAYNQAGKTDLAEGEWRRAVQLRPQALDAQEALAAIELQRREFTELATSAESLIKLLPASALGYSYRAVVEESQANAKGAEADLNKAIEVAPKDPRGYTGLGELETAEKRFPEAEKEFQRALLVDPNSIEAVRGLATDYLAEKRPTDAVAFVKSQLAKAPDNANYDLLLGQLLAGQKDYQGAEAALVKAADLSKNNLAVLSVLGQVQTTEGATDRAIATYQRAIQANPRDVQGYVSLGVLEEQQGQWQQAQNLYQKALALQPDDPFAANDLAYLMLQHGGNLDVALSLAQKARQGMPDNPGVADTLAVAYFRKGDYTAAIDLLKEALNKAPNVSDFNYHIALVYQKTHDNARAAEYLQRTLKLDPNYARAHEIPRDLLALVRS